jgi:hypothetical protein
MTYFIRKESLLPAHYNFKQDFPIAQATEKMVGKLLERNYCCKILRYNDDNQYDLMVETKEGHKITIEVKEDSMCQKTGNIGLEFECRGKPSGISVSKADWYIYVVHAPDFKTKIFLIATKRLKEMIAKALYFRIVDGGDPGSHSMNYLFKLSVFEDYARLL